MPVLGLALTLAAGGERALRAALERDARVTLGEPCGARLPIVLDSPGAGDGEIFISELLDAGHVLHVDVAFASFEDLLDSQSEETSRGSTA